MHKRLRSSRRALTKKVTSINFYVDQATQIQAIMEATGSMKEAPLVRQLVDEALELQTPSEILARCLELAGKRYGDLLG